jgi:hypothetical protein
VTGPVVRVAAFGAAVFVGSFSVTVAAVAAGAAVARRLGRAASRAVDRVELDEALDWPEGWFR